MRILLIGAAVSLFLLGAFGCDSGPCPSGTLLVDYECLAVESLSCDSPTALYRDVDEDGFGDPDEVSAGCEKAGYVTRAGDCDDLNPDKHPEAPEQCNELDDDCDGLVDEDPQLITWYLDSDADGYGDTLQTTEACAQPESYVSNDADCNDETAELSPAADELCNGGDENCNGVPDDGPGMECAFGETVECTTACGSIGVADCTAECKVSLDCLAPAEVCNGVDDDCDGMVDEELLGGEQTATIEVPDSQVNSAVALVSSKYGLYLFYLGQYRQNQALYGARLSDEGELIGAPERIRNTPLGGAWTGLSAVIVGASAYLALPPERDGPALIRVRLEDLQEIDSIERQGYDRIDWQGQCLATDGETIGWGHVQADRLPASPPIAAQTDFSVSFHADDLSSLTTRPVTGFARVAEGAQACALLPPRSTDNIWMSAYVRDGLMHLHGLTLEHGPVSALHTQYASPLATPRLSWDGNDNLTLLTEEGLRRYAALGSLSQQDPATSVSGTPTGQMLFHGGLVFVTTTDGLDIRSAQDLKTDLQYLPLGRTDSIVEHEGQIFAADRPKNGQIRVRQIGCQP